MGGAEAIPKKKKKSDVIIPQMGAAKYWYVDPSVTGQQSDPQNVPESLGPDQDVMELLKRIGISDQSTPSF